MPSLSQRRLTLADISDLRQYEREREAFRDHIISLKRRRRVQVGPFATFVFENADTVRFQIQEMARAERMLSDEQIEGELAAYNPLIPQPGELSATLFLELRTEAELEHWLPLLVGIEKAAQLSISEGELGEVVRCAVDPEHEATLTRSEATSSVHYIRFRLSPDQISAFAYEPVQLVLSHPHYEASVLLSQETKAELLEDLGFSGPQVGP